MSKFSRSFDLEYSRFSSFSCVARRVIALLVVLGVGVAVMEAQTSTSTSSQIEATTQQPSNQTQTRLNLQTSASNLLFSSSSNENTDALTTEASVTPPTPNFAKMMQYGSGQSYNRARYNNRYKNADGSDRGTFYVGGGVTVPLGNTSKYMTPSFDVQVGAGPRFNKHFALPVEFNWHEFGVTAQTLNSQSTIYFNRTHVGLDGNSHIWSFSIDPTYTFYSGDSWGGYVVGGIGYFHKVTNFTLPGLAEVCYWYCGVFETNVNIDHYTSNAPGYDGGFGLTYKFSPDSDARFYAEARYVFVANSQRYGIVNNPTSIGTITNSTTNFFPENSNRTTYIPITLGIRF